MAMGLIHIDQLDTIYQSYGLRNSLGVTWGHRGQKVIFTKNAVSPSQLYGHDHHMAIQKV